MMARAQFVGFVRVAAVAGLACGLMLLAGCASVAKAAKERPVMTARYTATPVKVDGVLDDEALDRRTPGDLNYLGETYLFSGATTAVVPLPTKGSRTRPPSGVVASRQVSTSEGGNTAKWASRNFDSGIDQTVRLLRPLG